MLPLSVGQGAVRVHPCLTLLSVCLVVSSLSLYCIVLRLCCGVFLVWTCSSFVLSCLVVSFCFLCVLLSCSVVLSYRVSILASIVVVLSCYAEMDTFLTFSSVSQSMFPPLSVQSCFFILGCIVLCCLIVSCPILCCVVLCCVALCCLSYLILPLLSLF